MTQTTTEILPDTAAALNNFAVVATSKSFSLIAEINEAHRLARCDAESAVKHATRCGELLLKQKRALPHGEFMRWIGTNCEFSQATANNYMRAAQNPNALGNSIRHLFPSGQIGHKKPVTKAPASAAPVEMQPPGSKCAESNVNAVQSSLTIEEALRMVAPVNRAFSELKAEVYGARNLVARRRNALAKAERKLADAEVVLIRAATKLIQQPRKRDT